MAGAKVGRRCATCGVPAVESPLNRRGSCYPCGEKRMIANFHLSRLVVALDRGQLDRLMDALRPFFEEIGRGRAERFEQLVEELKNDPFWQDESPDSGDRG